MKLKAFIKVALKGIIKDFPVLLFCFAVFPIALSAIYGYFQGELFTATNKMDKINTAIVDCDNTGFSKNLRTLLGSNVMKEFISINKEKDKADFIITIPRGYQEALLNNNKASISIKQKDPKTESEAYILSTVLNRYHNEIEEQIMIKKKIYLSTIKDKQVFLNAINNKSYELGKTSLIKNIIAPKGKCLTSYEYYSSSIFSFMFVMIILSLVAGYYKEKEDGIYSRIVSTSISKVQYFNYSLVTYFIFALIMNFIYVLAYKLMGLSFSGSLGLLGLIILAKSLIEAAISGIVIAFFKDKKIANRFLYAFIILAATIGGTFSPVEHLGGGALLVKISEFIPNTLIINIFKNYLLYNSFSAIKNQLLLFVFISIAVYIISIIKINIKWEA